MKNQKILSYTVSYQKVKEGGYVAFVASLPGCHTQGSTIEETENNIREAIDLYLESLDEKGEQIPQEFSVFQNMVQVQFPAAI